MHTQNAHVDYQLKTHSYGEIVFTNHSFAE